MKKLYKYLVPKTMSFFILALVGLMGFNSLEVKGQVSSYTFAQASGSYTAVGSPTIIHASGWDDAVATVTIPFNFVFNGTTYTSCNVSSNGFITFGSTAPAVTLYAPISGTTGYAGAISAFGRDLVSNSSTVVYGTEGTSPSRTFIIQWNNARRYSGSARDGNFNFQIRLNETTNVIQVIYGACATTYTTDLTVQVGLRGTSNADYNNRATTNNWPGSTAGGSNTATCNTGTGAGELPTNGLTYTWTPPVIPLSFAVTSINYGSSPWCTGDTRSVTATIQNTGSTTWYANGTTNCTGNRQVAVSYKWNGDANWDVYNNRNPLPSDVAPGASVNVTFNVQSPNGNPLGSNNLSINLIQPECVWFTSTYTSPAITIVSNPTVAVTPSPANAATGVCYSGSGAVSSVSWAAVSSATSYDVYFGAGSLPGSVTSNVASTSYSCGALVANTTYYWKVVAKNACGEAVGSSTWTFTTTNTPCYCSTTPTNVNIYDIITAVQLTNSVPTTYTNTSTSNGSNNYDVYNNTPYDLYINTSNTLAITVGSDGLQATAAWIDFNQNGVYEASENIALSTTLAGANATVSYVFTVPANAIPGLTRMRVRGGADNVTHYTAAGACTASSYGETEDYLINIVEPPTCSGTPSPGNTIASSTNICSGYTVSLSLENNPLLTGITYQWQSSTNGSLWSNITSATNSTYTTPSLTSNTFYRCIVTCTNSGQTNNSSSTMITVTTEVETYGDNVWNSYAYNSYTTTTSTTSPYFTNFFGSITNGITSSSWNQLTANWGSGSANGLCASTGADNFTTTHLMTRTGVVNQARWRRFTSSSDDGIRISDNGGTTWNVRDNFGTSSQSSATSNPIYNSSNPLIRVDHRENAGGANVNCTVCEMEGQYMFEQNKWKAFVFNGVAGVDDFSTYNGYFENATLNFCNDWGTGRPTLTGERCGMNTLGDNYFSVRYLGWWNFPAGNYKIRIRSDDGIRLAVTPDGSLPSWNVFSAFDNSTKDLTSGDIPLSGWNTFYFDFRENTGSAFSSFNIVKVPQELTNITSSLVDNTSCAPGSDVTLTVTGVEGIVYWYSGSCGGTLVGTGNSIVVSPIATTTYYARNRNYNDAGCGNTLEVFSNCLSITINVGTPPTSVNAGSDVAICNGGSTQLNGSAVNGQVYQVLYSENFDSFSNTNVETTSTPWRATTNNVWDIWDESGQAYSGTRGLATYCSSSGLTYCNSVNSIARLMTSINASSATHLRMKFYWKGNGQQLSGTWVDYGKVVYSLDGTNWIELPEIYSGQTNWQLADVDLSVLNGQTFFIGFKWVSNSSTVNAPGFVIDDVLIAGNVYTSTTYSWTPSIGLSATNIVNPTASPSSTTTYTMTATSNGCSASDQVVVTVKAPPTAPTSVSGAGTICQGSNANLTASGGSEGDGATYQWFAGGCANDAFTQDWSSQPYATGATTVNSVNGILDVTSTSVSGDPMIFMYALGSYSPSTFKYVNIRYRVVSGNAGSVEIFFTNSAQTSAHGSQMVSSPLVSDGNWQVVSVPMYTHALWTHSNVTGWRFDWATANAVRMEIDYISLSSHAILSSASSMSVSPSTNTTYFVRRKGNSVCTDVTACVSGAVNVEQTPVSPTLQSASPSQGSVVCTDYSSSSASFTGGSGGTGGNVYEISTNNGDSWSTYSAGSIIDLSNATIAVKARAKRSTSQCTSSWNEYTLWTIGAATTAPTLNTATPATTNTICAGYSVSATANAGSGGSTGAADEYRYSITGGAPWTTYTPGTSITTTGATGSVVVQARRTSGSYGCSNTDWTTIATWTVASAPVAPTLGTATPATTNSICAGYSVSATASGGSGGSTGAANEYQYSINGGGDWDTYSIGNSINTGSATGSVIIQSRRTAGSYGCATTAWSTIATWTVNATPVAPTLSSASPNTGTIICAGYNSGTVTATGGSGGSTGAANEYQYSINNGDNWSSYTNGTTITTTGATGSVIVQSRRTGGTYGCSSTGWSTISTWTVASTPTTPTLGSASPANGSSVCAGYNSGTVTGTGGSGGSTGAINKYRVSTDGGSSWADYTSGNAINTSSATGNIVVQSQRTRGDYGCVDSDWSTISSWTLTTNPTAPTLSSASPINNTVVCAGFNTGTVTGTGGSGGSTGAANEYRVSIDGGSNYSAYTSGDNVNTTNATGNIIVQSRRTAGSYGCSSSSWSTLNTWILGSTPVQPSLTEAVPASGTNICAGYNAGTVSITAGSGGSANAADVYQYSINNGGDYNTYTSGSAITTTGATGSVIVRAMRTGGDYGCSSTGWATLSTWNINNVPSAPTVNVASPATGTIICAGFNTGSVTVNAGSGGSDGAVDEYDFSINGGTNRSTYTHGSSITTTGASGSVIVRARRMGGSYGCSPTSWSTLSTWTVGSTPQAPTLSAASPSNGSTICIGYNSGTVTATGGSGGSTGAANEYQFSIDGGSNYNSYTSGSTINTDAATGSIMVQARRTSGSYGCSNTAWNTISSWSTVNPPEYPTLNTVTPDNGTSICSGANPSATFNAGSGGSGCSDSYRFSVNGVDWNTYTPGVTTITAGAGGTTVTIQGRRVCSANGCDNTSSYTTLANWTVVDDASLSDVIYSNDIICTDGTTIASSVLSGGAGNSQLQWQYYNGVGWDNVTNNQPTGALYSGANTEDLTISGITEADVHRYRLTAAPTGAGCGTAESNSEIFEVVNQAIVTISGSAVTVCTNASVSYTASGFGGAGAGQYKWQSSTNNVDWSDIGSATGTNYTVPTGSAGITYYRAAYKTANSGCDWQYSNSRQVTVVAQPSLSIPNLTNGTICSGGSSVISSTLSNGTGTPSYQWQYYNGSTWASVANSTPTGASYTNATSTSMTIANISSPSTYQYRLAVTMTGSGCNAANSDAGSLVVVADPSLSAPSYTNTIICSEGSTAISSNLSNGTGTPSYQWQYYNGSTWVSVSNNTPSGAAYTNATTNTLNISGTTTPGSYSYRLSMTMSGNGCNATESASESYTVVADPSLSAAAFTINTICAGGSTQVSSTLSNGTGTPSYQWLYNNSGSWESVSNGTPTGSSYSGATTQTLSIAGTTALGSHQYKLSVTMDGEGCSSTESATASFTVVANPVAQTISETPASGSEICIGADVSATFSGGSGGTGTISNTYEYSINSGSNWSAYTPGNNITTSSLGSNIVRIRTQRTATGEGCVASSYNTVQWTVVPDPELSAASLTNSTICSGGSTVISSTLSNGTGTPTYQWQYYNGSDWENVSNGTPTGAVYTNPTTDEMDIDGITLTGTHRYRLRVSMSGLDCNTTYSSDATLTVVSNPSLSALSFTNSAICVGGTTTVSSTLSNGTGTPTYTWEYYNGSDWNTVSNGTPTGSIYSNTTTNALTISAVSATGSHQYRLKVSMDGNGCAATQTAGLAYTAAIDPVAQTISESPIEGTIICQDGLVSASFTSGSGGAGTITNHYEYSVNGGGDWVAYTPLATIAASESGVNKMRFRTWRTATGNGCDNSSVNLKQWTVVENPQAPTATKVPNTETVCKDQLLYIENVQDEGGGTGTCELQYRYSSNSGINWSAWSTVVPSFSSVIDESNRIQARKQCDGYACVANIATFIWDAIDEMELTNPSFNYPVICTEGTTQVTTAIIGSAGQDHPQWQYLNANTLEWNNVVNGTPSGAIYTNTDELTMTISGIQSPGLYYYRAILNIPNSGCEETQSDAGTLRVTEQPSAPTFASKSPNVADVCAGQSLTLSSAAGGGTNSGVACSFEYRYFNGSISAESSSAPTFAAAAGTNYIEARRVDCQPGCNPSDWSRVAEWNAENQASVSITNDAEITCQNDALTLNIQVSNGTGSHSYQWQSSTNNLDWSDVPTETAASYTVPTNSVSTTYYRIRFQSSGSGCNVVYSPSYQVVIRDIPEVSGIQTGDYVWVGNVDNNWFMSGNWRLYNGTSYIIPSIAPASNNNIFIVDENSCVNRKIVIISGIEVEFKNIIIDEGFELRLID